MKVKITIDTDDIINQIWQEDNNTLIQFVKDLDAKVGDMDFTKALYEYFKKERERYDLYRP